MKSEGPTGGGGGGVVCLQKLHPLEIVLCVAKKVQRRNQKHELFSEKVDPHCRSKTRAQVRTVGIRAGFALSSSFG